MKFNYKFSKLLGTVYREGDIIFSNDGNTVICPVGNKISMHDLANNRSITLPVEAKFNYNALALSPDGMLLIASMKDYIHMINLNFRSLLYQKKLHLTIFKIKFSPNGKYFAVALTRSVRVYSTPSNRKKTFHPFQLVRKFDCAFDDICTLDWSHDSKFIIFGSKDATSHVCPIPNYINLHKYPLGGHKSCIVGTFFMADSYDACTVGENSQVDVHCFDGGEYGFITRTEWKEKFGKEEEDFEEEKRKRALGGTKYSVQYTRKSQLFLNDFFPKSKVATAVTSVDYKKETKLMVAGFNSGDFLLVDMTDKGSLIHSLNVSQHPLLSTAINSSGDWIALGIVFTGELLVWEWQSETHILKQQGHFNSMRVVSYSPDDFYVASGGEDGKVKLWSSQSSFCFVTFSEHQAPVTGLVFTQSGKAILSSSLDGTVRAFDLIRYRNFKTLTSPKPTQFTCLSVDSSGDLVVAGGQDNHDIFLWSLQTGKLLEILGGHSAPVSSLQFSSQIGSSMLISTSWDRSVKVWDAILTTTARETISLLSEGTCVAFRPDGERFACSSLNGHITIFNTITCQQVGDIDGKNDLGVGKEQADVVSAETNSKAKSFSTICYSPDGSLIIAGGHGKNVCIYSVENELLVKRFEITQNRSLDGVDKFIRREKHALNGINSALIERRTPSRTPSVPGCTRGTLAPNVAMPQIKVTSLSFSRTGRSWAACTTEGLLIYSLDEDWLFDPLNLEESITPESVKRKLKGMHYSTALMMACRLNIKSLIQEAIESIPLKSVAVVIGSLNQLYVESLIKILPELLESSRHIGFYSYWITSLAMYHGEALKNRAPYIISELNALQKSLTTHYDNLSKVCGHNEYTLNFLLCQGSLRRKAKGKPEQSPKLEEESAGSDEESSDDNKSEDMSEEEGEPILINGDG